MPYTYPPAAPVLAGDTLSVSRFLSSPTLVARRLRTLAEQRFIADVLLTNTITTDSGAVLYEIGENIYTDTPPAPVNPGAEYPLTTVTNSQAAIAKTVKWGSDVEVTDESISRQNINPVERAFTKLVNHMVKTVDSLSISAIDSAVTQSTNAIASWKGDTAAILRDIALAKASILTLNQGYDPDTLVVDDATYAYLMSDAKFSQLVPRESTNSPVFTGVFPVVAGLRILPTPNGFKGKAVVLDSKVLGGMVNEDIGSPGYVSAGNVGVEAKTIREDKEDRWLLRCRRITVPIIQEPAAAWKINGVSA